MANEQHLAKLVVLYNVPEAEQARFEQQYFETHVPLAKKMPGLRSIEVFKNPRNVMKGPVPFYMMATLAFDNKDALKAALGSPEGQAAGANIMSFASEYLTMLTTDVDITTGAAV